MNTVTCNAPHSRAARTAWVAFKSNHIDEYVESFIAARAKNVRGFARTAMKDHLKLFVIGVKPNAQKVTVVELNGKEINIKVRDLPDLKEMILKYRINSAAAPVEAMVQEAALEFHRKFQTEGNTYLMSERALGKPEAWNVRSREEVLDLLGIAL